MKTRREPFSSTIKKPWREPFSSSYHGAMKENPSPPWKGIKKNLSSCSNQEPMKRSNFFQSKHHKENYSPSKNWIIRSTPSLLPKKISWRELLPFINGSSNKNGAAREEQLLLQKNHKKKKNNKERLNQTSKEKRSPSSPNLVGLSSSFEIPWFADQYTYLGHHGRGILLVQLMGWRRSYIPWMDDEAWCHEEED